jgi:hypothetical protein
MEYHAFKFYNQAVVRQDSFPVVLYDLDHSQKEQRHCQSQNTNRPKTGKGLSNVKQKANGKINSIFLCAGEEQ